MNTLIMQQTLVNFKKELWEYKGTLLWMPVIMVSIILALVLLEAIFINDYQAERLTLLMSTMVEPQTKSFVSQSSFVFANAVFGVFLLFGLFVQLRYFISCLFDERRDLSIYFWRSMPVPDALVIAVKFTTGALIIPLVFMLAALVTLVLGLVILVVVGLIIGMNVDGSLWTFVSELSIFSASAGIWLGILPNILWLFPVYAWLMLASMFASRAPFLWATLPIVFVILVETFLVSIGVNNSLFFVDMLASYFGFDAATSTIDVSINNVDMSGASLFYAQVMIEKVSIYGLLVGAGLMYLTYWLRVNRAHG